MSAPALAPRLAGRAPLVTAGAVVLLWVAVAAAMSGRRLVPYPWEVLAQLWRDMPLVIGATAATTGVAAQGLLAGAAVVLPLAVLTVLLPPLRPVVVRVAVVVHAVPFVALAPILVIVLPGDAPRVAIAAFQVYFPLLIAVLLGLRSADGRALEVVDASGGTAWTRLVKVRLPSALPTLLAGLQVAIPASVLGALVAEFFGSPRGLGVLLVQAQASLDTNRTWALALWTSALAAVGYAAVALLARVLVPWAGRGVSVGLAVAGAGEDRLRPVPAVLAALASAMLLLGSWQGLRSVLGLDPFFVKGPGEVWDFLVHGRAQGTGGLASLDLGGPAAGTDASAFWAGFWPALGQTVVDAGVGFVVGILGAVVVAVLMAAQPPMERALMPTAIALRSVPLVAMTPLLVLVFGRGLLAVTVMIALVTFFPTLVNVLVALRSTPGPACDVVYAAGGSAVQVALRVRLAYAVPALTASARIAVPAAVAGATLAEWLATGEGLGRLLTAANEGADYSTMWSAAALLVLFVLACYGLVGLADRLVTRRLGLVP